MSRTTLQADATRDSFLAAVYGAGLVSFGPAIEAWTNKWFQYETLLKWNPSAAEFLPKTFLPCDCPPPRLSDWIAAEFPRGFVAKPSVGHSSKGMGLITGIEWPALAGSNSRGKAGWCRSVPDRGWDAGRRMS